MLVALGFGAALGVGLSLGVQGAYASLKKRTDAMADSLAKAMAPTVAVAKSK